MKHYTTLLASLCITSTLFGAVATDEKIDKLTQEVQELKKELSALKEQQQNDIDDLYDFTESVETRILEDKIKFSLGLKFGDDFITKHYLNGVTVHSNNLLNTKFMLGMYAKITEDLNFHGRLSMYKYWGSSRVHSYSYFDNMQGRVPSSSGLYVERAYINWFIVQDAMIPVALTIGRQPSSDGPSHQFKDNLQRKATYSALLYDGAADGAVLTLNLSKVLLDKTYMRLGYSKGFGYVNSDQYVGNAYIGASNSDIKDTNLYGVFFDTALPNVENSLVQLSYSRMNDIIANPLDINYTNNQNIGDMDLFGVMVEVSDFQESGLDLFAHYGYNKSHPNGATYVDPAGNVVGLLGDGTQSKSGSAYWLGGRYALDKQGQYRIGFEYNHGSQNWVSLTQGAYDLYNKLATRGDVYETYISYIPNRYLNFRLGYLDINYKYRGSGWFIGDATPLDVAASSSSNTQCIVDKLHAIYLKMNVNY